MFALGVLFVLAGLGVNLAYHRVLSHRSLKLPKWLERVLVTLGLPAGTPVQWAGNHRYHHAHADTLLDPHSPVHQGFWYAHVGWYLRSRSVTLLPRVYALAGPVAYAGGCLDASRHQSGTQCTRARRVGRPLVRVCEPAVALCDRDASACGRFRWASRIGSGALPGSAGCGSRWCFRTTPGMPSTAWRTCHGKTLPRQQRRFTEQRNLRGACPRRGLARKSSSFSGERQAWSVSPGVRLDMAGDPRARARSDWPPEFNWRTLNRRLSGKRHAGDRSIRQGTLRSG